MEPSSVHIGFVGVGRMGANMARRLKDQGYGITALYDCRTESAEILGRELECSVTSSPARVAEQSHIVFTVVSDDAAMRDIYDEHNPAGLIAHAEARLFINCATVTPAIHRDIEHIVEQHGGTSLEACMAGSITQARQGTLFLMCGGKTDVFTKALPLLNAIGTTIRHIGPAG